MALEAIGFDTLAAQGIHLDTLREPVDVIELAKRQYSSGIWLNEAQGAPFGREVEEMLRGNYAKIIAATDNPKKATLYEHAFDTYNLAHRSNTPIRVEFLTAEQKAAMGAEPAWNNVLYVATHKNMMARHERPDLNGMVFSTDILTGAVLADGAWKIFHKLGRIDDLRQQDLEQRAEEIAEIMAQKSTWFWISGTTMQTKDGLMMAGRYYQAEYMPVPAKAIQALFVRDFQRGKAQSIPHGVDVLTDLEKYGYDAVGMGVTWQMMEEDRNLAKGDLRNFVDRQLHAGAVSRISVRNLNAMMLGGVPALDGIRDVHWTRPQSAQRLELVMNGWVEEDKNSGS